MTLAERTGRKRTLAEGPLPPKPQLCAVWRSDDVVVVELGPRGEYLLRLPYAEAKYLRDRLDSHLRELKD